MEKFQSIIMASDMGEGMKSQTPKAIHKVLGKPLLSWVIGASKEAGAENILTLLGDKADMVRGLLGDVCAYTVLTAQEGTDNYLIQTADFIKEKGGIVVALSGYVPLITAGTIEKAVAEHKNSKNAATVISAVFDAPFGYGRIIRDANGGVEKIIKDNGGTEVREIDSGMYVFESGDLLYALEKADSDNTQGGGFLAEALETLLAQGRKVGAYVVGDTKEVCIINDRIQLAKAEKTLQKRIVEKHMLNGVTFTHPKTVTIEADVEIGIDTIVQQNVILKNGTKIGNNCIIGMGTQIDNTEIRDNVDILSSVMVDAFVDDGTHVGPFAYIRPNTKVGKNVKVGDFVELKNSVIDDGTKISHLTYIGDSDVGKRVNFGCGTVTVNYDGRKKFRSKIGDDSFIGCNTNLVSPVNVGAGAYIAAGSTITDDVPGASLAIARARQVVKQDWVDRRKRD